MIGLILIIIISIVDIITMSLIYGKPLNKKERKRVLNKIEEYTHTNPYNQNIIRGNNVPCIANAYSLFFSHYVDEIGTVYRFTELSKKIKKKTKELKQNPIDKYF